MPIGICFEIELWRYC